MLVDLTRTIPKLVSSKEVLPVVISIPSTCIALDSMTYVVASRNYTIIKTMWYHVLLLCLALEFHALNLGMLVFLPLIGLPACSL